jgi:hypothetical protein
MQRLFYAGIGAALKGTTVALNTVRNVVEQQDRYAARGRTFVRNAASTVDKLRLRPLSVGRNGAESVLSRLNVAQSSRVSALEERIRRLERERSYEPPR